MDQKCWDSQLFYRGCTINFWNSPLLSGSVCAGSVVVRLQEKKTLDRLTFCLYVCIKPVFCYAVSGNKIAVHVPCKEFDISLESDQYKHLFYSI